MAAIGVLTELGLVGVLVLSVELFRLRYCDPDRRGRTAFYWCCAVVGIYLTPAIIGVPLFGFAFVALTMRVMGAP